MKSLKYTLAIGVLCAGMSSLAHADLIGPHPETLDNNGAPTELKAFQNWSGHEDATMCIVQQTTEGTVTNAYGSFTFTFLDFNPNTGHYEVQVDFTMNPGHLICGFLTKNGAGNDVFLYEVTPEQGSSGSFVLEVPHTGQLSHIDVFCCVGEGVPDGGTTVMLLGVALGALGMVRRYLTS